MPRPVVIGISGFSGAGKTTLIEQLLSKLTGEGLQVALIKHQHETVQNDQPGTDTFRFFQAGAAVLSYDGQSIFYKAPQKETFPVEQALDFLGDSYDLILVEGFKNSNIPKVWLLRSTESKPPKTVSNIIKVLPWNNDRLNTAMMILRRWCKRYYPHLVF